MKRNTQYGEIVAKSRNPFGEIAMFLVTAGKLDQTKASIYALGLNKLIITSKDVVKETDLRQNTAGDYLRVLAKNGYFETVPSDSSHKGAIKKYKAIPPSLALKDLIEKTKQLPETLAMIQEHLETQSESLNEEDDIWLIQSQEASIAKGLHTIKNAKKSVRICSNDCSWFSDDSVRDTLRSVLKKKIPVTVIANPNDSIVKKMNQMGIEVRILRNTGIPYCIVDESILMQVTETGSVKKRYNLIITRQPYMVKHQLAQFEALLNHTKKGGD